MTTNPTEPVFYNDGWFFHFADLEYGPYNSADAALMVKTFITNYSLTFT